MLKYTIRLFQRRLISLGISVIALSISIASLISCFSILESMKNGRPNGVNHDGPFISFFSHLSSQDLSVFFYPQQLINLKSNVDEDIKVIASTGGNNYENVVVEKKDTVSAVSFVSDDFFDVLKINITNGNRNDFFNKSDRVCLVSTRFLEKNNLSSLPNEILIDNKNYNVVGLITEFSGLFDDSVEIWIPWQHGHHILARDQANKRPFMSGMYWAIITTSKENASNLALAVDELEKRTDLLTPPIDGYKSIEGISWDVRKRNSAEESTALYFYVSVLMFIISVVNLSTWSSLTRLSKLHNELTFLKLGVTKFKYFQYNLLLILIPVALAFLFSIPIYFLYLEFLLQEPAIRVLFENSANIKNPPIWKEIVLLIVITSSTTFVLSSLIAKVCGVSFNTKTFNQSHKNVQSIFHLIYFVIATLTSISVIFSIFIIQYTNLTFSTFNNKQTENVFFVMPIFDSFIGNQEQMQKLKHDYQNEFSEIEMIGISSSAPFSNLRKDGFSLRQYSKPDLSILLNSVDKYSLEILGVELLKGFDSMQGNNQLIVDSLTESRIKELTGKDSVIGLTIFDRSSEPYEIIGIGKKINYSTDPMNEILVAYKATSRSTPGNLLVIKGAVNFKELKVFSDKIKMHEGLRELSVTSYEELQSNKLKPFLSRILLCLIAALLSFMISLITIIAIVNVYLLHQKRRIAIYSALGMFGNRLWWKASRALLSLTAIAGTLGIYIFLNDKINAPIEPILDSARIGFSSLGTIIILVVVITITLTIIFSQLFMRKSIFDHLRNSD